MGLLFAAEKGVFFKIYDCGQGSLCVSLRIGEEGNKKFIIGENGTQITHPFISVLGVPLSPIPCPHQTPLEKKKIKNHSNLKKLSKSPPGYIPLQFFFSNPDLLK